MRLYLPVFFMGGLYFVQILGAGMSGEEWEGVMFSRRPHSLEEWRRFSGSMDDGVRWSCASANFGCFCVD